MSPTHLLLLYACSFSILLYHDQMFIVGMREGAVEGEESRGSVMIR